MNKSNALTISKILFGVILLCFILEISLFSKVHKIPKYKKLMVSMNSVTDLNECPDIQGFTGIKAAGYCVYDLQRKYFNYETLYDYADRRETTHAKALENLETHAQSALGGSSYRAKAQSTCQSLGLRMPSDSELVSICKTYMFQAGHFMSTSNTEMVSFPSCEVVGAINAYNFTLCIK